MSSGASMKSLRSARNVTEPPNALTPPTPAMCLRTAGTPRDRAASKAMPVRGWRVAVQRSSQHWTDCGQLGGSARQDYVAF
eukprot:scaffold3763_cov25-Prasinocladus_malaysianus.AAC.1